LRWRLCEVYEYANTINSKYYREASLRVIANNKTIKQIPQLFIRGDKEQRIWSKSVQGFMSPDMLDSLDINKWLVYYSDYPDLMHEFLAKVAFFFYYKDESKYKSSPFYSPLGNSPFCD